MRKALVHILLAIAVIACIAACSGGSKVIPRKTLSKIYAEMFVSDQWLKMHSAARRTADTSLFYEPIFRKYGYTTQDYIHTLDVYISDPDDFAKVLKGTVEILEERKKELQELKEVVERINELNKSLCGYKAKNFDLDSLIWTDSSVLWHGKWASDSIALPDTVSLDSLVRDSLVRDSLIRDSLVRDSIFRASATVVGNIKEIKRK